MTVDVWPALEVSIPGPGRGRRDAWEEAVRAVEEAAADHDRVYLVDRRGVQRNKPDVELIQEVAGEAEVWVDAGPRYAEDIVDLLVAGAAHVVVRWHTLDQARELGEAADMSGDLSLGAEFEGKAFLENPREPETDLRPLLDRVRRLDLGLVVVGHPGEQGNLSPRQHAHAVRAFDGTKCYMGPVPGDDRDRLAEEGFEGVFVDWPLLSREESEDIWG